MLTVENLRKSYRVGTNTYEVLKGISFHIEKGEFVAVMGASGSGKSTLLNCISCYIPYEYGQVVLGNRVLSGMGEEELADIRNQELGFVFQDFMLLDGLTVQENILLPKVISGRVETADEERALLLCKTFGIEAIKNKYPAEISGGERQRTAVARALMNQPLLILADEPTGNLDSKSGRAVIEAFETAKKDMQATIFMVTHDSFSASFCDRVLLIRDGVLFKNLKRTSERMKFQDELLKEIKNMSMEESEDGSDFSETSQV